MKKKIEIIGFVLSWFAVIAQFVLIIQNRQTDIPETIIRFFTFFTILTNLLVALYFSYKIFSFTNNLSIFNKKSALTAITTFILIVGLVYQFILRGIWEPQGMQRIVDELLHSVIPLFVLVYWIVFSEKGKINFRDTAVWLLYPLIYFILVLIRGHFSNYYPYPFLNVSAIGIEKVLLNSVVILLFMLVIMAILVGLKNRFTKNTSL